MTRTNSRIIATAVFLAAGLLTFGHVASAQERVKGVLEACEGDIIKFCEGVTPGNGHIIACMYAYEDQITDECSVAIMDFGDAIDNLFFRARQTLAICAPDIMTHCDGVQIGGGRILSCLTEVSSELDDECRTVTAEFYQEFIAE